MKGIGMNAVERKVNNKRVRLGKEEGQKGKMDKGMLQENKK